MMLCCPGRIADGGIELGHFSTRSEGGSSRIGRLVPPSARRGFLSHAVTRPRVPKELDARARGGRMQQADYVFAQAWKRSNYPMVVELARAHDLVVNPAPR